MDRFVAVVGSISKDLFHLQVPWGEKVIRALVVYAFLVLALRLFGRRELGQFTAFDLVVLLTLSNILQNAMIGNDSSLLGGMIGAAVLLSANFGLAYAVFRNRSVQRVVTGQPRVLIRDGSVQEEALAAERLTEQDLLITVRNQGLEDFSKVHLAISEPNGTISVIPSKDG
ncbi:MAG: DUF421 domain-containing protein [Actinomycetota bacterium]|nr:DUF421 domain-containing protein [Actinomycetota bacterium]